MGVTSLWRLIEPTGKPVPVETLENKVLAVDISIWLHQMVKGYQDAKGAPLPNAHLMGLFQRLCKLLYFRIKPVFVFDGAFPELKRDTISKRQDNKSRYHSESERLKRELAILLGKKTAVSSLLGKNTSPKKAPRTDAVQNEDDLFKLPVMPETKDESESESEDETSSGSISDLHSVDLNSEKFKKLPAKEKYDVLIELKETRKMNSWGRLHELPKKSDNFSDFQMQRLLKRRKVQECLEETEKEIGSGGMSLNDIESILNEEGIETKIESLPTRRIASNNSTRYLLIQNVKKTLADAKEQKNRQISEKKLSQEGPSTSSYEKPSTPEAISANKDELEDDLQKAIQMSLECADEPNNSMTHSNNTDESWSTFMTDSDHSNFESDSEENDGFAQPEILSTAKAYIMQYTDYTPDVIDDIIVTKPRKSKVKVQNVNQIIEELNKENSIVTDKINLSSEDDTDIKYRKIFLDKSPNESISEPISNNTKLHKLPDDIEIVRDEPSIIHIEHSKSEVICLDTSVEEENVLLKPDSTPDKSVIIESESSDDDDFEEVLNEDNTSKAVVQLTLTNVGEAPDDDIFADVFLESTSEIKTKLEYSKTKQSCGEENPNTKTSNYEENTDESNVLVGRYASPEEDTNKKRTTVLNLQSTILNKPLVDNCKPIASCSVKSSINKETYNDDHTSQINDDSSYKISQERNQTVNTADISKDPISTETLGLMAEEIENQEIDLMKERGRLDRIGRNITEEMTKDAQELLKIFGIPYIVAPTEAEAQCAFLESVNLTDGTITDDSDIWLFGGRTVYKNFFNQKKHVLQFLSERIERSFNLSREQMILLALLVGSDYTTGVTGVGPVTALEILASFPYNKKQVSTETTNQASQAKLVTGLQEFKKWVRSGKRTDNTSLKKKLRNVEVSDDFPSIRVVQAYLVPNVEKSEEKFSWGELNITILRDYTKAKFGWSQSKFDEIIKPVLKRMQDRQTQRTLQDYFKRKIEFGSLEDQMSKRVKAAVHKMGPEAVLGIQDEVEFAVPKVAKKRKITKIKSKTVNEQDVADQTEYSGANLTTTITPNKDVLIPNIVKVKSVIEEESKSVADIKINKTNRFQETIPQREKDKQSLLQNKLKAIEVFRKSKIDRKRQPKKRRVNVTKAEAELSESSDSN